MNIYDYIDSVLKERGISRRQLAIDAGIPPTTIQSLFTRKRNMTIEILEKIAHALGLNPVELLHIDLYWEERAKYQAEQNLESLVSILNSMDSETSSNLVRIILIFLDSYMRLPLNERAEYTNAVEYLLGDLDNMIMFVDDAIQAENKSLFMKFQEAYKNACEHIYDFNISLTERLIFAHDSTDSNNIDIG